jgi:hypothetical protein
MDGQIILKIFRDVFRTDSNKYPSADVLTLAHDNDRSLELNGRWYSPLINTIEDELGLYEIKCVSIARIISRIKGNRAYGRVYSPEGAFARALVLKRICGLINKTRYPYSKAEERIWTEILKQTGVRHVIGIQPSRELCVACRERGIWVADVQHGVIADEHPWYGEKYRATDPTEWLPNAFLVWDYGSTLPLSKWAFKKGIDVNPIGNRWVARFQNPSPTDKHLQEIILKHAPAKKRNVNNKTILVTLSWGNKEIPNWFLHEEVCRLIKKTADEFNWLLRLHPNQINGFATDEGRRFKKFFDLHLNGAVEWETTTRSPLPIILAQSDLHISWNSSVAIEAAQMGVKSALMDPRLQFKNGYFRHLRSIGMVSLVKPSELEMENWISENRELKGVPLEITQYNQNYKNLIENIANQRDR